eukprot:265140_1
MEMEQWDSGSHGVDSFQQENANVNAVQYDGNNSSYPRNDHHTGYRNDNNDYNNQNNMNQNRTYYNNNNNNHYQPRYAPRGNRNRNSYNDNNYRRNNNNYRRQQYNNNSQYGNRNRPRYQPRNNQQYKRKPYTQYQPKQTNTHNPYNPPVQPNDASYSSNPSVSHPPPRPSNRFVPKKKFKRQIEDNLDFEPQTEDTYTAQDTQLQSRPHTQDIRRPTTQYVDESEAQIRRQTNRYSFGNNTHHHSKPKSRHTNSLELENLSTRAKEMALQLQNGKYDCMVCQSFIGKKGRIWKCNHCFTMFHMTCVNKWARAREQKDAESEQRATKPDRLIDKIRCPACNFMDTAFIFNQYKCFCGKVIFDHEYRASYTHASSIPHSCGDICNKKRGTHCPHACPGECHPGPCEACKLPSDRKSACPCGKLSYSLLCGQTETKQRLCTQLCDKLLKCGNHRCESTCHHGECKPCDIKTEQECFCGKNKTLKACGTGVQLTIKVVDDEEEKEMIVFKYSCHKKCDKDLSCGNHRCTLTCHNGSCSVCPRRIEEPTRCSCSKSTFEDIHRSSCLDPLPVCGKKCGKMLGCGQHFCRKGCHDSKCALCMLHVKKKCRCRASEKKYKCHDYQKKLNHFIALQSNALVIEGQDSWIRCGKKCKRVKSCGKHTCAETCCRGRSIRTYFEGHQCREFCNKPLECGRHRCASYCHRGNCNPCGVTYRNGVQCACGEVFVPGPFQCGTKHIPMCKEPCEKVLPCDHLCVAKCHPGDCPPCIRPCSKPCNSHGLLVHNMPCHVDNRSCGNPCGRLLHCGAHHCVRTCHNDACTEHKDSKKDQTKGCGQICNETLKCGHKCMYRCHGKNNTCHADGCKAQITVKCKCGNNWDTQYCRGRTQYDLKAVPCNEHCAIEERNKDLRDAFNIPTSPCKKKDNKKKGALMIPYAAAVLERMLKWMQDKGSPTMMKNEKKVIKPKFVYYMEGVLDAYLSDKSSDFKAKYCDITVLVSHTQTMSYMIDLRPMSSEQRYIVYTMAAQYHIRCEKKENSGKKSTSYLELSKTAQSHVADYLLSSALIEYQVNKDEIRTLESMPPQHMIVIDNGTDISSSLIQDRLLPWAGLYRMFWDNQNQLFMVFIDENARNSAMTSIKTFGARKATQADSLTANAVQVNKKNQKKKKKLKAQHSHAAKKNKANNQGWLTIGDAHVEPDDMIKMKPQQFDVKMNNRFG